MKGHKLIIIALIFFMAACDKSNKTLPYVNRENGNIEILNCEKPWDKNATYTCPMLYCHKSIYEAYNSKEAYKLVSVEDRHFGDNKPFILSGVIKYNKQTTASLPTRYKCTMRDSIVIKHEVLSEDSWLKQKDNGEFWQI